MKKFIITCTSTFLSLWGASTVQAQILQNQGWVVPPYQIKIIYDKPNLFNLPQQVPVNTVSSYQGYVANGIFDNNLNLLFYIQGDVTHNANGYLTDFFKGNKFNPSHSNTVSGNSPIEVMGSSEIAIVPDPANCDNYYILSAGENTPYFGKYSVNTLSDYHNNTIYGKLTLSGENESMNTWNSFRDLIPNSFIYNQYHASNPGANPADTFNFGKYLNYQWAVPGQRVSNGIAVTKKRSDNSHLIFVSDADQIYRFKLDHNGIHFDNSILPVLYYGSADYAYYSEMEIYEKPNGNYLIAKPIINTQHPHNKGAAVYIAELDNNGDLISHRYVSLTNAPYDNYAKIRGLEFSPNGNYLYVSHVRTTSTPASLRYINLANNTIHTLSNDTTYESSQLELAANGKIYGVHRTGLFCIDDPNHPTTTSVTKNAQLLGITNPTFNKTGELYTLPDQIDGMSYTDHFFSSIQCCVQYEKYEKETFKTTTSGTWSAGQNPLNNNSGAIVYIRDSLVIRAGHTITISGMEIRFAPGAKLIIEKGTTVQKGGQLILTNGSKLTADTRCSNEAMWQGVIVEGNPGLPQIYNLNIENQARIEVYGNSTIEHALVGIMAGSPNQLNPTHFSYSPAGGGGVVICDGANFRNNVYDVRFQDYTYNMGGLAMNNLSNFNNTNFFTDAPLNIPSLFPIAHLSLVNVRGIKVNSCSFENRYQSLDDNTSLISLGTGINTQNSTLYVGACNIILLNQPCTNGGVTYFGNLQYGINALSSDPTRTVYCRDAYFDKNTYGINLMGMANAFIYKNEVIVPKLNKKTYGVFMKYCTNYVVEENFVKSNLNDGSPGYYNLTYGIVVEGSNHHNPQVNNRIYKNYLTEIGVATQSQGLNGSTNSPSDIEGRPTYGLAWRCNEYSNQMLVAMSYPNGRVKYDQGVCNNNTNFHTSSEISKSPAGNRFINFDLFSSMGIYTGSYFDGQINYVHHEDNSQPSELIPGPNAGVGFSLEDCDNVPFNYNGAASCPERVFGNSFTTGNYNWSSLFALREHRLALTSQVNNANFEDNYFNGMYSIEEITSFLWTKNVVSDYLLSKYLDLNPPREYYMDIITGINDGLSEPIATKIIQKIIDGDIEGDESEIEQLMLTNNSKYSKLISDLSFVSAEEDYLFSNLMTYYHDSENNTSNFIDSMLTYLESDTNIARQNLYMYLLLDMGRFEDAYTIAEIVAYKSGLNYDHFMTLFNLYKNLYSSSETIEELVRDNESRYSALQFLSENGNNEYIQYCAQQLLNSSYQIFEKTYHIEDVLLDEEQGNKPAPPQIKNTQETASVVIYPNPSLDFINVIARGKDAQTFDRIEVTNMLGQSVIIQNVNTTTQHSLSIENLSTGSYIIRIFNNKLPIHQQVIIKK